jgi:carboxyl-terminal processing protease
MIMPKISLLKVRKLLIIVVVSGGIFSLGYFLGLNGFKAQVNGEDPYNVTISRDLPLEHGDLDFSLFWRVWDTLTSKYFDKTKIIPSQLVYGAIKGMVSAIGDPYTVFLPPTENKVVQEDLQGAFEGVGIQIGFKGTQLAVMSPLPNSPAEAVGVKAGDYIIGIRDLENGIDRGTGGMSLPEAVQLIRGRAGTKITLTLLREGNENPFEVDIVRANIDVASVTLSYVGENESIAHIKILKFAGETMDEWEETVLTVLKNSNTEALIIDVRNNPGGYLQGAVDLASDFLETGQIAVIEEDADGSKEEFKVEKFGRFRNQKAVILVNEGSASASEIFAGALRDNKKVPLVGQITFGKGTIQEPQQVNNGAGLHITIARWLTPSGYWVNDGGLVPDYEVEDNPDTPEDEQLNKAIEVLSKT